MVVVQHGSGVAEDSDDGEKGHSILCSIQLVVGAHLAPPPPGLRPNPWACSPLPIPRGQWGLFKPLGLLVCAFWVLSGHCFPLLILAPKEVFFFSEWVWRMTEPLLICSCSCLLKRALGRRGGCYSSVLVLLAFTAQAEESWRITAPVAPCSLLAPKRMKGKLELFFHKETHFSVFVIGRGYIFLSTISGDNRNIILSEKIEKCKNIYGRLTSINNTTLNFCIVLVIYTYF